MGKVHTVRDIWDMIEGWLASNTPWIHGSLAPGATEDEIQAAEAALGLALPVEVRQSYRIHNGQKPLDPLGGQKGTGFVYGNRLQTLDWIVRGGQGQQRYAMVSGLDRMVEVVGPVKRTLNNPQWVPLTHEANHTYYLDMDPAEGGDVGQLVLYIYDEVKGVRVSRSFHEWLLNLAVRLQLGMYVYSESIGCLVTVADRADEMEAKGIKTEEEAAEYRRLREIQRLTTLRGIAT